MSNFDDLAMAVASFGGNNAVKFDDLGMPSIMVGIPKMKYSDIITGGTQETLPWWIVDGVEKEVIWVSKYINVVVNDRAYSLPMKDPKCHYTDNRKQRHKRTIQRYKGGKRRNHSTDIDCVRSISRHRTDNAGQILGKK